MCATFMARICVTIHGLVLVEKRNLLKKRFTLKRFVQYLYQGAIEKRFLSILSWVIVDTEYVREAVKLYPIRKKPEMYVIPQGINDSFFDMSCAETSSILLSVGAYGERKGHLLTLKAFEELRKRRVQARLVFAGSVASKPYYEQLKQAVKNSNYGEDIVLYNDVSDKQLKDLYQSAHVFVLHSEEESQGIVFAEAMAVGLPVVSTIVGGIPYVVSNGITGFLSVFGDIQTFSDNMEKLMENSSLWKTMSASAKLSAESYHWSVIAQKINELYGQCQNLGIGSWTERSGGMGNRLVKLIGPGFKPRLIKLKRNLFG